MRAAVISFTARGDTANERISAILGDSKYIRNGKYLLPRTCSLAEWTRAAFEACDLIIFIGAAGIAVRAIAPYIRSKAEDPAVLVTDEAARYVIPILSGHMGGANEYAKRLADRLGAKAVITTATDINDVFAADVWAVKNGYSIANRDEIKTISAALLDGERVGLASDFEICGTLPEGIEPGTEHEYGLCISDDIKKPFPHTLNLIPKRIVVGAGSKRGAQKNALIDLFEASGTQKLAVCAVATIDIKRNEPSVKALADYLGAELLLYSAEDLNNVAGDFEGSDFVRRVTGTDNVCERAAAASGGQLILRKTKGSGVTLAAAAKPWSVKFDAV